MINAFAFFSLVASVVCSFLGLTVYFLNRKSLLNKLFMIVLLVNAYWAFAQFMIYQASDIETAALWSKVLFLWPFLVSLMVHFTLVFTESDLLKKKITYVILYFPALIFSVVDLTTNLISTLPVKQFWGYTPTISVGSWMCHMDGLWSAAFAVFVVFAFVAYYYRVSDKTRKQQTKYVGIGFAIPIFLSILTDSAFPVLGIQLPGLGSISGAALSGFVVYAIWKYDLFTLNPAVAAENIVSTMPDSLILANIEGKILQVNKSLLDLLGYQEKEVTSKSITQLSLDKETGAKILAELLAKRELKNYETECLTKSGVRKTVTFSGSVVKDKRNQDVGINCIIHDITQQKDLEKKLVKAEKYASIGELAGMIGHDLRNPLTSVRGAVYYLKAKHSSTLDANDILMFETIEKSIDYSNKIINDLLDYSREITLELELATPKSLINNALSIVQIPSTVKVVDSTEDTYAIRVDKCKISRVLVNITSNAIDAMPQGGTLTMKSQNLGDHVLLSLKDTGSGMTEETLGKLWTPLFTTKAKGMGFGLAICKRIIEAHGGKIWAESVIEKGTTINVEIPLDSKTVLQ